jgi:preprotein translocase subunit SecG
MIIALIKVVHVLVCAVLIVVVLLQHGKGTDIAATFSGAGTQMAFGPRGTATALSRLTTWCAIIFMFTAISLTIFTGRARPTSVMQDVRTPTQSQPAKK